MRSFEFECRTKIYFGTNILESVIQKSADIIKGKILIVTTGGSLIRYGYLQKLKTQIERVAQHVWVYDAMSANPKLEDIIGAIKLGIDNKIDIVIGFGGGSAIDAAKASALGIGAHANLDTMEKYLLEGISPDERTLPVIAIPTTAGTGSELSKAAIISSSRLKIKSGIRGKYMQPCVAIVDAALTWSVPEKITMETGFDTLAHAIESYLSVKADWFSETLSEKAIQIAGENLKLLKENLDHHEAREAMCYASMIMGMNLANVGTCLPHRMQYPIGINTNTTHAAGLIALYPVWLRYEYDVNGDKVKRILELLSISFVDVKDIEEAFRRFQKNLGIDYSLGYLGIKKEDILMLISQMTGSLENDKLYTKDGMLERILTESI